LIARIIFLIAFFVDIHARDVRDGRRDGKSVSPSRFERKSCRAGCWFNLCYAVAFTQKHADNAFGEIT
jgi:hypothetical protein